MTTRLFDLAEIVTVLYVNMAKVAKTKDDNLLESMESIYTC